MQDQSQKHFAFSRDANREPASKTQTTTSSNHQTFRKRIFQRLAKQNSMQTGSDAVLQSLPILERQHSLDSKRSQMADSVGGNKNVVKSHRLFPQRLHFMDSQIFNQLSTTQSLSPISPQVHETMQTPTKAAFQNYLAELSIGQSNKARERQTLQQEHLEFTDCEDDVDLVDDDLDDQKVLSSGSELGELSLEMPRALKELFTVTSSKKETRQHSNDGTTHHAEESAHQFKEPVRKNEKDLQKLHMPLSTEKSGHPEIKLPERSNCASQTLSKTVGDIIRRQKNKQSLRKTRRRQIIKFDNQTYIRTLLQQRTIESLLTYGCGPQKPTGTRNIANKNATFDQANNNLEFLSSVNETCFSGDHQLSSNGTLAPKTNKTNDLRSKVHQQPRKKLGQVTGGNKSINDLNSLQNRLQRLDLVTKANRRIIQKLDSFQPIKNCPKNGVMTSRTAGKAVEDEFDYDNETLFDQTLGEADDTQLCYETPKQQPLKGSCKVLTPSNQDRIIFIQPPLFRDEENDTEQDAISLELNKPIVAPQVSTQVSHRTHQTKLSLALSQTLS